MSLARPKLIFLCIIVTCLVQELLDLKYIFSYLNSSSHFQIINSTNKPIRKKKILGKIFWKVLKSSQAIFFNFLIQKLAAFLDEEVYYKLKYSAVSFSIFYLYVL